MSPLIDTVQHYNDLKLEHVSDALRQPRNVSEDRVDALIASVDALERLFARKGVEAAEALVVAGVVAEATLHSLRDAGHFPGVTDDELTGLISTAWLDGLGTGLHHKR